MEHQLCVLFYSNYSQQCNAMMNSLKTCPVNLQQLTGLTMVCIDNENIRKRIIRSSNIALTSVPTILLVYNDGNVEKYEGQSSFDWVTQVVQLLS